ncbi:hypothetical protein ACFQVC_24440 [Streptomyces monticola]|uniref:DUF3040 domain-containing protein n=1 Tax=Streptomyces monticola TaxID=2666263 RepID=A0ABW2JNJ8_9ACTN
MTEDTQVTDDARLAEELRELGRSLRMPDVDGETMAERVIGQLLAEATAPPAPAPPRRRERLRLWVRRHWRRLVAAACGTLTVLALTPPVRAAVIDFFGFGGVEVRYDPQAPAPPRSPVPGCGTPVGLADAARRAGFTPVFPARLGSPDSISVTTGPAGRSVISLCWRERGGVIRMDEFPARLDPAFGKTVRVYPEYLTLDGGAEGTALWFAEPHRLTFWMTDDSGERWQRAERPAGPTLLWSPRPELTARLEGEASRERAVGIARSTRTAPATDSGQSRDSSG